MKKTKRGKITIPHNSLVINLIPIMHVRNVKTPFTYLIKLGIPKNTANKLLNGEAVQISMRHISSICTALNCTPNEIYYRKDMPLPEYHQLNQIRTLDNVAVRGLERWLEIKSMEEVERLMKE